ncbi:unnamed protein product [Schistocephalus solidus]|uniref:Uncharacterized protein n=1 Tax=Schistocephalus solidus TaxID=70667 RepID=A0A183SJ88_SCHSO|nr:unnamed protein product [Schistocephalus solidus]
MSSSHPDENIVQQLPAPRPMVHPCGHFPFRKVEERVGQQATVLHTRSQKKEAVIVTATVTVGTQHSLPGSLVQPNADVDFNKDKTHHWGSLGADDEGEHVSPKRQAEAYQAIIDTLRQNGQTSHDISPDGEGDASVAPLCL